MSETLPQVVEQDSFAVMPAMSVAQALTRYQAFKDFYTQVLRKNMDYGTVPGTEKPTLYKPGAEKLTTFFGLSVEFEIIERVQDWTGAEHNGEAFFYYLCRCHLYRGDRIVASADGSCNSWESKYRWRWVGEHDLPPGLDPAMLKRRGGEIEEPQWAVSRAQTSGEYGKPAEYWQRFKDAIASGEARQGTRKKRDGGTMLTWVVSGYYQYRVPNEDVMSQVNTILKMAQKRAFVAATLIATNASEFFTQDVEDYIDGEIVYPAPAQSKQADKQPQQPAELPPLPKVVVNEGTVKWALEYKSAKGTPFYRCANSLEACKKIWQKVIDSRDKVEDSDFLSAAVTLLHEDAGVWLEDIYNGLVNPQEPETTDNDSEDELEY